MKRVILLLLVSLVLLGCGEEEPPGIDNEYQQRIFVNQQALFDYAVDILPEAEPSFVTRDDEYILNLGSIDHEKVTNHHELMIFVKLFDYMPDAELFVLEYRRGGVYGNTNSMIRMTYDPMQLTFTRDRTKAQIPLNETWTCMTFEDMVKAGETGKLETDCYSYRG